MKTSDNGMAPQVVTHPGTRPTDREGGTVDARESSVFRPSEASEDTHPHACLEGVVYIGHLVEEVEAFEAVSCRKCVAGGEEA